MNVVVIGCGRVGSGLAYRLGIDRHEVTVIDNNPTTLARLGPGFTGRSLVGDGLDRATLEDAGVAEADALAAVTGKDEVNAVVARLAVLRYRVPRVVARMYEPRQADLYSRLGVLTISPVEWGIARLGNLLTMRDISPLTSIGGGGAHLLEAEIPSGLAGRHARELEIPGESRIVSVTRAGRTFLADRATVLEAGDMVAIAVASGAETRLQQLLGGE
jgi:trk system potassium uptake protein